MRFGQIITDFPYVWYLQLTYWKCTFGVVPGWGICAPFLSPTVRHKQLFQNDKYPTYARKRGGGGVWNGHPWKLVDWAINKECNFAMKVARKSFENIEQLGIFHKCIFWRCYIMLMRLKHNEVQHSWFAVYLQKTLYFLVFHRNIGLKTSKY